MAEFALPPDGGIAANPFNLAAAMQVPPYAAGRPLGEVSGPLFRTNHSLVSHEGVMYMFGGRNGPTFYNNVHKYNSGSMSWTELKTHGDLILRRGDHSAVLVGNKMVVYGGRKQLNVFGDMYQLDLQTNAWSEIKFEKTCSPGLVFSHAACASAKLRTMFVVGGVHELESKRHLIHSFDFYGKYWRNIAGPPGIDPTLIHICHIGLSEAGEKLFVLGLEDQMFSSSTLTVAQKPRKGLKKRGGSADDRPTSSPQKLMSVFFLNLQTHVWTRVRTVVSPSSSVSFSTPKLSELLLPYLHLCNSCVSVSKDCWYFFALLNPEHGEEQGHHQQYGLFIFDFVELKWFLSPMVVGKSTKQPHEQPMYTSSGLTKFESKYCLTSHTVKVAGGGERLTYVIFGGTMHSDHIFLLMTPTLPPHGKMPHLNLVGDAEGAAGDKKVRPHTPQQGLSSDKNKRRKRKDDADIAVFIPLHPKFSTPHSHLDSSGVPLIRLDTDEKLNTWMQSYYKDQCKWLLDRRNEVEGQFVKAQKAAKMKQTAVAIPMSKDEMDKLEIGSMLSSEGSDGSNESSVPVTTSKKGPNPATFRGVVQKGILNRVQAIRRIQLPSASLAAKKEQRNAQIEKKFCVRQLLFDSIEFTALPLLEGRGKRDQAKFLAKLRWKLLQKWVLSGEAAVAMRDDGTKKVKDAIFVPQVFVPSMPIGSIPQLSLTPKLVYHRSGDADQQPAAPQHAMAVPQRPVPYHVPAPPPLKVGNPTVLENGVVQYTFNLGRRGK